MAQLREHIIEAAEEKTKKSAKSKSLKPDGIKVRFYVSSTLDVENIVSERTLPITKVFPVRG